MNLICFDLEGVFVPEIWIAVAAETGIKELELTTRDVPDYDDLMRGRLQILGRHNIGLKQIQSIIETLEPYDGALELIRTLRARWQAIILSDTFEQFAKPLMRKLEWPTLFCNRLIVEGDRIIDYSLRLADGKRKTVSALSGVGLRTAAVGDSYNDLGMIDEADIGLLFRAPAQIRTERPDLTTTDTYEELEAELVAWADSE